MPSGPEIVYHEPFPRYVAKVERIEDMSARGRLKIMRGEDGDILVGVITEEGKMADIEFCTMALGGGRSPRTFRALLELMVAMEDDNKEEPIKSVPEG